MKTNFIQVNTTTDSEDVARRIADKVLELKLAACAQITGPITSMYKWKGAREESTEWLVMIKTSENLFNKIKRVILKVHTYELPEIIAFPINFASDEYSEWILSNIDTD